MKGNIKIFPFPSNFFCHTVPKKFVEKPFCVSGNFGYRKMLKIREGAEITIFRQNCSASHYRIFLSRNDSVFYKIFGIEKFYGKEGGGSITIFF